MYEKEAFFAFGVFWCISKAIKCEFVWIKVKHFLLSVH